MPPRRCTQGSLCWTTGLAGRLWTPPSSDSFALLDPLPSRVPHSTHWTCPGHSGRTPAPAHPRLCWHLGRPSGSQGFGCRGWGGRPCIAAPRCQLPFTLLSCCLSAYLGECGGLPALTGLRLSVDPPRPWSRLPARMPQVPYRAGGRRAGSGTSSPEALPAVLVSSALLKKIMTLLLLPCGAT